MRANSLRAYKAANFSHIAAKLGLPAAPPPLSDQLKAAGAADSLVPRLAKSVSENLLDLTFLEGKQALDHVAGMTSAICGVLQKACKGEVHTVLLGPSLAEGGFLTTEVLKNFSPLHTLVLMAPRAACGNGGERPARVLMNFEGLAGDGIGLERIVISGPLNSPLMIVVPSRHVKVTATAASGEALKNSVVMTADGSWHVPLGTGAETAALEPVATRAALPARATAAEAAFPVSVPLRAGICAKVHARLVNGEFQVDWQVFGEHPSRQLYCVPARRLEKLCEMIGQQLGQPTCSIEELPMKAAQAFPDADELVSWLNKRENYELDVRFQNGHYVDYRHRTHQDPKTGG